MHKVIRCVNRGFLECVVSPKYLLRPKVFKSSSAAQAPKVCVVGSGPAGFYVSQQLIKAYPKIEVDLYERLPVPFGLVRFGVAPDHPEVKNVINTFTKTAKSGRLRFVGNVNLGTDVILSELRESYHAVVLTYGAEQDREFGIPGEELPNVVSARRFVGWYNGLPADSHLKVNLETESAVIFGNGNVAVDVARILLTPVDILKKTDITEHSLAVLSQSRLKKVIMVGRRGPLNVAFTIKEIREMLKLPECKTVMDPNAFAGIREVIEGLPRPRRRLMELVCQAALDPPPPSWSDAKRTFEPLFLRSPLEFLRCSQSDRLSGVRLAVNKLSDDRAVPTGVEECLECGLALRSIGYKGIKAGKDIPFDDEKGTVLNNNGQVDGAKGLYCSGWVATGPTGVILTTMSNSFEVGHTIVQHMETGLVDISMNKPGYEAVSQILLKKGIQTVSFSDWEKIDEEEKKRGEAVGKPREKIVSVEEMLAIAAR
ncbi:NADPH:adrenodoxin oxidoreductase, mitochondrial [Ischnura elegans]|uniref:NADPH:adrenodoxin oxidoreductase, mitochondrial n=1 Tax=Ischnura elegans TaxID=197161 RepID=UPI001ED87BB0|nr:NADPH:adrenodoxin oxidoreductase, mitochondrial [Ischnura elegans]